jgi:peptidoglycan hydrolase CwlO-like protein
MADKVEEQLFNGRVVDKALVLLAHKKKVQYSIDFDNRRIAEKRAIIEECTETIEKHAQQKAESMRELNDTRTALEYLLGPYKGQISRITEEIHDASNMRKEQADEDYRASALINEMIFSDDRS